MGRSQQAGFTLIELMVTISIMGIVLAFAIPSFESVINSNRLASAANEMIASLQTSRMEAVRRNRRTAVCFSANANAGNNATCVSNGTVGINGWITFVDNSNPHNLAFDKATDTLLRATTINAPVQISGNTPVVYRSDGMARDSGGALINGAIRICIPTARPAQNVRRVNIGSGSRISVEPVDNSGTCS